ncbi:MAG: type II toxin-antitoxin system YoeB family toxin [Verrucomicrobiota bacterium]
MSWQASDPKVLPQIHDLLQDASMHPFKGLGRPDPLRHALAGYGLRRVIGEHRRVYKGVGGDLRIAQLRYHD